MEEKKTYTEGISMEGGKFSKWLDNFWYHYKWPTIGIAFALIVFLICKVQACSKEEEDITLLYAGRVGLPESSSSALCDVLEAVMPADFDGNGTKMATLSHFEILSEEQIKQAEEITDAAGNREYVINRSYNSSEYNTYYRRLQTGESSVLLLDPWLYQALLEADRLMPLSSVLQEVPQTALDGSGVRLGDTEWYWNYSAAQVLPEDTVICLLYPYVTGKSSKPELYQREKQMFAALTEQALLSETN